MARGAASRSVDAGARLVHHDGIGPAGRFMEEDPEPRVPPGAGGRAHRQPPRPHPVSVRQLDHLVLARPHPLPESPGRARWHRAYGARAPRENSSAYDLDLVADRLREVPVAHGSSSGVTWHAVGRLTPRSVAPARASSSCRMRPGRGRPLRRARRHIGDAPARGSPSSPRPPSGRKTRGHPPCPSPPGLPASRVARRTLPAPVPVPRHHDATRLRYMSPAPMKHVEEHFLRIAPPEGASQACPRKVTVDRLASAED